MVIRKEILKQIIISNEEFIQRNVDRIVQREDIRPPRELKKVTVFYGVRRSGKTFILFDIFKQNRGKSVYIDFEDERITGFEMEDFEKLKEAVLELKPDLIGKEIILLLDEVQNITGWERFCRRGVERENFKIYVSGSSSKIMPQEIHTELRGRSWSIEVFPFSFKEYLDAVGVDRKSKSFLYGPKKAVIKNYFSEYLKWGGFPEVSFLKSELEKKKLIKEYLNAMFFRDIVERYRIKNIQLLDSLIDTIFSSFSANFSLTSFYKQYKDKFPFSKDLLFRYYRNLLQSMLVFEVRKFAESTYKRRRNPAKVYLIDTALSKRTTSADIGRILENIVFLELKRRGSETFYFEEERGCDFIVKNGKESLYPIQVCYELTEENREREFRGLLVACKWTNSSDGILLTYDEADEITVDEINIKIIPVWVWLCK